MNGKVSAIMLGFLPKGCVITPDTMHPNGTQIKLMLPASQTCIIMMSPARVY